MTQTAILLIDHGSSVPGALAQLTRLADLLAQRVETTVYPAHMSLGEPTIAQAYDKAAADGARRIVAVPLFLTAGRHVAEDVPRLLAQAARKHPQTSFTLTEPLGLDPKLADVLADRVGPHIDPEAGQ